MNNVKSEKYGLSSKEIERQSLNGNDLKLFSICT